MSQTVGSFNMNQNVDSQIDSGSITLTPAFHATISHNSQTFGSNTNSLVKTNQFAIPDQKYKESVQVESILEV